MDTLESSSPVPKRVNFIFTNRCNLRCTYCPEGSHPEDYYADLGEGFEEIFAFIRDNGIKEAGLAYYGELTTVRDWWIKARHLLGIGVMLNATTNGHLPLTENEVATFAQFKYLEFSIDSHDENTVRDVRKKTSVARIVHNFHLIRAYCLLHKMAVPELVWTGVLTKHVVHQLPGFIAFAASNGVSRVNFNEVQIYDGANEHRQNIVDLDVEQFQRALVSIEAAMSVAERLGIALAIAELPRIRAKQEGRDREKPLALRSTPVAPVLSHVEGDSVPEGFTRECSAPWTEMYLDPKGRVFACCNRGEVMGIAKTAAEMRTVYANDKYQMLRRSLELGGTALDKDCATCAVRPVRPLFVPEPAPVPLSRRLRRRALQQLEFLSSRAAQAVRGVWQSIRA